jgi:hypothetical protein
MATKVAKASFFMIMTASLLHVINKKLHRAVRGSAEGLQDTCHRGAAPSVSRQGCARFCSLGLQLQIAKCGGAAGCDGLLARTAVYSSPTRLG